MKPTSMYYMIEVSDMDRAVAFYRDVLGLTVKLHTPHWSSLSVGDATVGLHPGRADDEQHDVGLGIDVSEAEIVRAYEALETAGATIVEPVVKKPLEGIWLGRVADTEGNVIMVTATIPR